MDAASIPPSLAALQGLSYCCITQTSISVIYLVHCLCLFSSVTASGYFPLVCINASIFVDESHPPPPRQGWRYIPGAGDDSDNWASRFSPALFWSHHEALLHGIVRPEQVDERVEVLVQSHLAATGCPFCEPAPGAASPAVAIPAVSWHSVLEKHSIISTSVANFHLGMVQVGHVERGRVFLAGPQLNYYFFLFLKFTFYYYYF
jgi:hypothetical protein